MQKEELREYQERYKEVEKLYKDKIAIINGNKYSFTNITSQEMIRIFVFYTQSFPKEKNNIDFSFLSSDEGVSITKLIENKVEFNGNLLSMQENHWELYPEDYLLFITNAIAFYSFPCLKSLNNLKDFNTKLDYFSKNNILEIKDKKYNYSKLTHLKRVEIFGYYTKIESKIVSGDFSFLLENKCNELIDYFNKITTYNHHAICNLANHWNDNLDSYLLYIIMSFGIISYPFLRGKVTN